MKDQDPGTREQSTPVEDMAIEVVASMFDDLVHRTLNFDAPIVRVIMVKSTTGSIPTSVPIFSIEGASLRAFALDLIPLEVTDPEVICAIPGFFDKLMREKWEATMDFYAELRSLEREIHLLSLSEDAGYLTEARALRAGKEQTRGNYKKTLKLSRGLAEAALKQWVEAVGLPAEAVERQHHALGDQPNIEVWSNATQLAPEDSNSPEQVTVLKRAI